VVLGDHGIKEQGASCQEINVNAAATVKFTLGPQDKNTLLSTKFDQLRAQFRATDEAGVDLSRQTGDLALYGIAMA
jgi:ATP-binding cassette subfamily C (CFTR/MRP) protein 1